MNIYSAYENQNERKIESNVLKRDFSEHEKDRYLPNLSLYLERAHISRSLSFVSL